jgi:LacI family transcriptional regulator
MATIRDVAKQAGLSVATISKYLNGGPVREKNRGTIQNAINALGYQVNPYARSLKTRRSMSVGVLLPSMITPFFTNMLTELDLVLRGSGYHELVSFYGPDHGLEREKFQFLVNAGVDGLIYAPEHVTAGEFEEIVGGRGLPVILTDRLVEGVSADTVLVDNTEAVCEGMGQLISRGHRRIAIINGPEAVFTAKERMAGYLRALAGAGIAYDPALVKSGEYSAPTGYRSFQELMAMPAPPTAVFTTNYDLTLGALTAAHERGVKLPDEVALYGFDCSDICNILVPPVPVIAQPEKEIGRLSAQYLLERMEGYAGAPRVSRLRAIIPETVKI